jgi:RimJ/RimL family protein N-acetyltransferase
MRTFSFQTANLSDIDALVALEKAVEASLPSREMFAIDDADFYIPIVSGGGHILLAFDEHEKLAGVSVIRYPSADDAENLGLEIGLCGETLLRVRHAESIFIRPDCGGHGLAGRLLRENLRLTENSGRDLIFATIWPHNFASLKLHLSCGFHIWAFALKYGGKPRFVLMASPPARAFSEDTQYVSAGDFEEHKRLLGNGMAGTGYRISPTGESLIEYRRMLVYEANS